MQEAQEAKDAAVQMGSVVSECETTRKDVGTLDGSDVAPSGPGLPLVTVAPIHVRSLPIVACGSETNDSQLDHTQNVPDLIELNVCGVGQAEPAETLVELL